MSIYLPSGRRESKYSLRPLLTCLAKETDNLEPLVRVQTRPQYTRTATRPAAGTVRATLRQLTQPEAGPRPEAARYKRTSTRPPPGTVKNLSSRFENTS